MYDVSGATRSLLILALTYRLHPIELADGKLGCHQTDAKLSFDDVKHISNECLRSKASLFDAGTTENPDWNIKNTTHYAIAIEWMEAAEM